MAIIHGSPCAGKTTLTGEAPLALRLVTVFDTDDWLAANRPEAWELRRESPDRKADVWTQAMKDVGFHMRRPAASGESLVLTNLCDITFWAALQAPPDFTCFVRPDELVRRWRLREGSELDYAQAHRWYLNWAQWFADVDHVRLGPGEYIATPLLSRAPRLFSSFVRG